MGMAATMAMVLPTMVTMDTHMPTITDTTMARGLLMPSPLPLLSPPLMLMLTTDTTDIPLHMPTTDTMARGPLMPSPLLMLDTCTDTMDTDIDTDMPTTDTTATESNHLVSEILRI